MWWFQLARKQARKSVASRFGNVEVEFDEDGQRWWISVFFCVWIVVSRLNMPVQKMAMKPLKALQSFEQCASCNCCVRAMYSQKAIQRVKGYGGDCLPIKNAPHRKEVTQSCCCLWAWWTDGDDQGKSKPILPRPTASRNIYAQWLFARSVEYSPWVSSASVLAENAWNVFIKLP